VKFKKLIKEIRGAFLPKILRQGVIQKPEFLDLPFLRSEGALRLDPVGINQFPLDLTFPEVNLGSGEFLKVQSDLFPCLSQGCLQGSLSPIHMPPYCGVPLSRLNGFAGASELEKDLSLGIKNLYMDHRMEPFAPTMGLYPGDFA